jgi:hypothetical protein
MTRSDDDQLNAALRELRPRPTPEFTSELDERAAAGFPRRRPPRTSLLARLRAWLRERKARQLLLPAGGVALVAIGVATALVSSGESGGGTSSQSGGGNLLGFTDGFDSGGELAAPPKLAQPSPSGVLPGGASHGSRVEKSATAAEAESAGGVRSENLNKLDKPLPPVSGVAKAGEKAAAGNASSGALAGQPQRKVERSAEITIGTKPGEVGAASTKVFQAVHAYDGVVLNSSTRDGSGTDAEASFELLIPSAKLGDAMAAFSRIGEVRSRHEATADITAPTVGAEEKLEDSRARTDSLLAQLREASEEGERELVEAELRAERRRSAHLQAQLDELGKRASLSRVSVRVESGKGALSPGVAADGKWGVGDAISSAGRVLAVAAGVAIIGAAVLAPIALLLLLAWLAGRAWSRRARERALS